MLSRLTILQKSFAALLFVSIIPLLVVGITSYQLSRTTLAEQATAATAAVVADQKDYLELHLQQIDNLIANISGVDAIVDSLDQPASTTDTYTNLATKARIGYILNGYTNLKGLVSIDIFTMRNHHYHVGDTLNVSTIRTDLKDRIFAQAMRNQPKVVWTGIEENIDANSSYPQVMTAAKILTMTDSHTWQSQPVALLVVNYDVDDLYDHFRTINLGAGAYLMVIDAQNRIMYHPTRTFLGDRVSAAFMQRLDQTTGTFTDSINGQPMIVTYQRLALSDWVVVSLIPVDTLMAPTETIGITTLIVLFGAFVIVAITAWLVSRHMVIPIRDITHGFKRIQAGTFGGQKPLVVTTQDEIGELTSWFNTFVESLQAKQRAEEALRTSEERYSLAMQGANDGIWDWDLQTDMVHYSPRWKAMLSYQENANVISPAAWFSRMHPEDHDLVKAAISAHLENVTPYFENEHRVLAPDGSTYRWVLARGLAVRDHTGSAYRLAGSLTDMTHRKAIEAHLWHAGMHDQLTNLPNRSYFMNQVQQALERVQQRSDVCCALLFLDLDRFKIVNDSLGHAYGDQLLITTAQRLMHCIRMSDTAARFGGDEFAILLDDVGTLDDATQTANRIQANLSAPLILDGHTISVSASIGIVLLAPAYRHADDLLRDADTALYQAKANGKAQYAIFDEAMHAQTLTLLRLEADLKHAIEHAEFRVHYQPIVSLADGHLLAVEALLRWEHPTRGLVFPGEFIPLAEETGLIISIGEWILRTACAQARAWRDAGATDLVMSVNLSSYQMKGQHLPQLIADVLAEYQLPGEALQVEITESAAMVDLELTIQSLQALRALGVRVAMDDFGTGYSSLGYLQRLPIDQLKIAQSFVRGVPEDAENAAIGSAIIAMAHILGLVVIAEGVETTQQSTFLQAHGCDAIQGFLVSRALPAAALTQRLALAGQHWLPERVLVGRGQAAGVLAGMDP